MIAKKHSKLKKYGFIAPLLNLHWYIGDNRGTDTILASPGEAEHQNEYDRRKYAAPHELVHALNSNLNPQMPLWLNEGTALYLTNGNPPKHLYSNNTAPTLAQTDTSNPIEFANMGGYNYAYTYVEFLDQTYGWEQVLSLLKNGDYVAATGITKEALYLDWIEFLKSITLEESKEEANGRDKSRPILFILSPPINSMITIQKLFAYHLPA